MAQSVKGMRDLFGSVMGAFQRIEDTARRHFSRHGYREIRTPILEYVEVFKRAVGDSSDIVNKEMYQFRDRGDREVVMRPENTAAVVRSLVEHKLLGTSDPQLFFYMGPMFRYERMQAGRFRQFWQIGAESFGVSTPESEVESFLLLFAFFKDLGLTKLSLTLNSVGTPESRPAFHAAFRAFFEARKDSFCGDCHRRIGENPLRVLDCKVPGCQTALEGHPVIMDFLDDASRAHHERLLELLTGLGLPFEEDPRLVRGLDYYTRTAFEVKSADLGAQSALVGGGRYDALVKMLGGPDTPAFGWALGLDRLAMVLEGIQGSQETPRPALLVPLGDRAAAQAMALVQAWWAEGCDLQVDTRGGALKKSLQTANRQGFTRALILGDGELDAGTVTVKDLATGLQESWGLGEVPRRLRG